MLKKLAIDETAEDFFQSILATPNRQRKLLSKTFWEKFGVKVRTAKTVETIGRALSQRSIVVSIKPRKSQEYSEVILLGKEHAHDWIVLTYAPTPKPHILLGDVPTPTDTWFSTIEKRVFESEREVEYYFIMPLLEQLGYEEEDIAIGFPVVMAAGSKTSTKQADVVVFAGSDRTQALIIIEAKKGNKNSKSMSDAIFQAKSYALWLPAPFYFVTDGDLVKAFLIQGMGLSDIEQLSFVRSEMRQSWKAIYKTLNKASVIGMKQRDNVK